METRKCTLCKVEKPLDDFFRRARNKTTGRSAQCKECEKPKWAVYNKNWRRTHQDETALKEWREARLLEQEHRCPICSTPYDDNKNQPHIDHSHITGSVRDIICRACNIALGFTKDNVEVLEKMIKYLKGHA